MPTLQRPPTIREIVLRSILRVRDAADTLIDGEELAPRDAPESRRNSELAGDAADRVTEVDPLPPARAALDSVAFELRRAAFPGAR